MPSSWHDSVTAIFTENPELAVEIAASLNGALVPRGVPVRVEAPNFNDRPSTDFEADAVIVAGPARDPVRAVIVEAQKRTLTDKPPQWARYAAQLWTFLRCPVDVLVICPDAKAAFWYARPVPTTLPGYTHQPIVLLDDEPLVGERLAVLIDAHEIGSQTSPRAAGLTKQVRPHPDVSRLAMQSRKPAASDTS